MVAPALAWSPRANMRGQRPQGRRSILDVRTVRAEQVRGRRRHCLSGRGLRIPPGDHEVLEVAEAGLDAFGVEEEVGGLRRWGRKQVRKEPHAIAQLLCLDAHAVALQIAHRPHARARPADATESAIQGGGRSFQPIKVGPGVGRRDEGLLDPPFQVTKEARPVRIVEGRSRLIMGRARPETEGGSSRMIRRQQRAVEEHIEVARLPKGSPARAALPSEKTDRRRRTATRVLCRASGWPLAR